MYAKIVVLLALVAFVSAGGQVEPRKKLTANIDAYLDILLKQVNVFLIKQGMDPFQLEDIEKSFSVKPALITYHGELKLTKGWLQGISSIIREGDAEISYQAMLLNLRLPLAFETLLADFDYSAKVMDLGPTGAVDAKISNLQIYVDITIDTKTLEIILQDFKITDAGKIKISFSGHPVIDWLANVLTSVVTTLLHDTVVGVVQKEVRGILEKTINDINSMRPNAKPELLHFFAYNGLYNK